MIIKQQKAEKKKKERGKKLKRKQNLDTAAWTVESQTLHENKFITFYWFRRALSRKF